MTTIIFLLKSLKPHTGNNSTIQRLRSYFDSTEYWCLTIGAEDFKGPEEFQNYIKHHNTKLIIGIHAYHAGRLLTNSQVQYIIIFGGTDLNELSDNVDKLDTMTKAIERAETLVAFSSVLQKQARVIWNDLPHAKLTCIPQAVMTQPSNFRIMRYLKNNNLLPQATYQHECEPCLLTMVAGIRPVKDPLFLTSTFSKWNVTHPNSILLILGPVMDEIYAKQFKSKLRNTSGIIFIPGLPQEDVHATICDSYAVINSSISEGMSSALLEAMDLETLVIVRDNLGNRSIVKHNETGLVFETPTDFIACLNYALHNETHRRTMIENAKQKIIMKHGCEFERQQYHCIVNDVLERASSSFPDS